jgi:hypothetical protein
MCYGELSGEVFQVSDDQLFPPKQSLDGAPGTRRWCELMLRQKQILRPAYPIAH